LDRTTVRVLQRHLARPGSVLVRDLDEDRKAVGPRAARRGESALLDDLGNLRRHVDALRARDARRTDEQPVDVALAGVARLLDGGARLPVEGPALHRPELRLTARGRRDDGQGRDQDATEELANHLRL